MTTQDTVQTLRDIKFLDGIADDDLPRLAEISRVVECDAQKIVFREHEHAADVYLVIDGTVSLVICTPSAACRQLVAVDAGELLGWAAVLNRPRLSATARTLTPTRLMAIDGARLIELCRQNPGFGFEFMRNTAQVLSERLYSTRVQLLDLAGRHLPEVTLESD